MPDDERNDTIILGRKVGTDGGWDTVDDFVICLYEFRGTIDSESYECDLMVDWSNGTLYTVNEEGSKERSWDISVITNLPRTEPLE